MVHFWTRSSASSATTDMLQPREGAGRSAPTLSHAADPVGNRGGGGRGGSKSGGAAAGGGGGGGLCLLSRLGQYKRRQHEQQKRRVAEKELDTLHQRIDKLLAKMEERDAEALLDEEEECVVCLGARATMQTFPCEHRVVCRKCFIRTIQVAVAQRSLPLRCVLCRARILKLRHGATGCRPVSVGTQSPLHSSSAPPGGQALGHSSSGFFLNTGIVNNNNNNNKISSLGRVAPLRPEVQAGKTDGRTAPSAAMSEPPRVTLVKDSHRHFSAFSKAGHVSGRDASPLATLSPGSGKMSAPSRSVKTEAAAKFATPNRKADVIGGAALAGKGTNSQPYRRGRVFPFKPLFWRQ